MRELAERVYTEPVASDWDDDVVETLKIGADLVSEVRRDHGPGVHVPPVDTCRTCMALARLDFVLRNLKS